jgi:hypothetical protein
MLYRAIFLSPGFAWFLLHGQTVLLGALLAFAVVAWFLGAAYSLRRTLFVTAIAVLIVRIIFAGIKTYAQYYIWAQDTFGQLFLPPHTPWSYFVQYTGLHFWLSVGLALLAGIVAYIFLLGLHKYRERFFEGAEAELGLAICLIVGWPSVLVLLGGTAIGLIVVSIIRRAWLAQTYTTLGIPLIIGGVLAFLFASFLIGPLGLTALKA